MRAGPHTVGLELFQENSLETQLPPTIPSTPNTEGGSREDTEEDSQLRTWHLASQVPNYLCSVLGLPDL